MEKIIKVKDEFVNPFYDLNLNKGIYILKNIFSNKIVLKWKYNSKHDETFKLLNKISKLLQIDILYDNKRDFDFINGIKLSFIDNFRYDVDRDTISKLLLRNLKLYEIKKFILDEIHVQDTILYSGSEATKRFSIIENLDDNLNCSKVIKICNNSDSVLFEKKYSKKYIIGPFLESMHLKTKNLEILDRNFEPSINEFFDNKIILNGINDFINEQQYFSIIEKLSNYLYQSSPLYNRRILIDNDGFVKVSDILPLF